MPKKKKPPVKAKPKAKPSFLIPDGKKAKPKKPGGKKAPLFGGKSPTGRKKAR